MQIKELKAKAHRLEPVVIIGAKGLTEEVCAEVERALAAHELIKIRAAAMDRHERERTLRDICARVGAQPVQSIGKVLVIYREKKS